MKTSSQLNLPLWLIATILPAAMLMLSAQTSLADSATWNLNPGSGDWNTATNWTPAAVPNGPSDTATFVASNQTIVSVDNTEVNGIIFNAGASLFTIKMPYASNGPLIISGTGIMNNSGITQSFIVRGGLAFFNNATAGSFTHIWMVNGQYSGFYENSTAGNGAFTVAGDPGDGYTGGQMEFRDSSTAGDGTFTVNGFLFCGSGSGGVTFLDTASAGNAVFTLNSGAICGGFGGGIASFGGNSTAGNGIFTINGAANPGEGGGVLTFQGSDVSGETPTAGNATLIANGGSNGGNGGSIQFLSDSLGGTSRVEVFSNGNLDISAYFSPDPTVTIGSIEGTGAVFLGASNLTVGSNNLSATFSGTIQDQGGITFGTGGSLTKIGTGTLTLSGANTYTGVTTVSAGTLLVTTRPSSGTGNNKVKVNAGTLGGTGVIGGAVTIGRGSGPGAFLAPGTTSTGTLTLKKTLTFKPDGTYKFELKANNRRSDAVAAKGVVINTGALFTFIGLGNGIIPQGTVFTAINNTAATPISGRFSNLADGSTFTVGSNTYLVSYHGGTGNDLTLTVQ